MQINLNSVIAKGKTLAVAVSGGSDSMALLHFCFANADKFGIRVVALNVEHGIRGDSSISDTNFVKDYCSKLGITLLSYSVDSTHYAKEHKLSIEESARILRYNCFYDSINSGKCDVVATAHHTSDNVESVLLNLFRGSGLKGLTGINSDYNSKIIRPFLSVSKEQINEYVKDNSIPYVTDESNFCSDYTRNFLRLNVIPKIKEVFPEMEKGVSRFSSIAKLEDEYLDQVASENLIFSDGVYKISANLHKAIFSRAIIKALKNLGLEKDWEKAHVDDVLDLVNSQSGAFINLPKRAIAIKEYDKIVLYKQDDFEISPIPFSILEAEFGKGKIKIEKAPLKNDLTSGLFIDMDKVPCGAVIRTKQDGDVFTKFGGGTKKLNDYLTDKKIPLRLRDKLPILAIEKTVLAIFTLAISDNVKADANTKNLVKLTYEELK